MLTPWKSDRILVDPFCGSGTFPIEAAMIAANMAPGMNREFLSEDWKHLIPRKCWYDAMDEANDLVDLSVQTDIQGYDIDGDIVRAARANAKAAGVDELIHFQQRSVSDLSHPKKYGFLITNPPYGCRSYIRPSASASRSWTPGLPISLRLTKTPSGISAARRIRIGRSTMV